VTTEIKHLSHDVKNINQKLDAYPTQPGSGRIRRREGRKQLEEKTTGLPGGHLHAAELTRNQGTG
jgi:hypothetical protein